ncbi:hypothetical protein EW026_g5681 [Hermanssonia centrifuga]|uniref:Amino acid permease/ SLC12A domain-containing protein n=1 Tax=Hermanssonia centrifuga TaxID=98765 RepID=A0A4V3X9Z4_9APHY|nr:hypothetical protein EW026_g5681 [Hermanssonia centrifuga]
MISIGGVIGTGLFLGSATALYNGGPVGALLGYSIVGSVVYCLCVSIGEMIAFLPNVGGIVGLADLYVDPAVGFSLGWAAWYNWSVTLPTEIAAAAVLVGAWDTQHHVPAWVFSAIFLILATSVNCFSSRVYGEFEFWFSTIKVVTIVFIIFVSLLIDLGAGSGPFIGFKNWKEQPFASNYLGIDGSLGRFLGFWAVLMQASFSFFGSEVPGIAAGEVIDATRNVPRALQRVWIRITLFYVGGIFCAGLLVSPNNPALQPNNPRAGTAFSSPFVIAFNEAGFTALWYIVNAAILLSAWSAAASDIYISSRFLFFLARCRHAPQVFATLFRYPSEPNDAAEDAPSDEEDVMDMDDEDLPYTIDIRLEFAEDHAGELGAADNCYDTEDASPVDVTIHSVTNSEDTALHDGGSSPVESSDDPEAATSRKKQPWFVLPLYAVLGSASIGLLSFLSASSTVSAESAFNWLSSVASVASLQSWAGMLFTYIRWFQGTAYAERKNKPYAEDDEESRKVLADIQQIKINRHWGQPYLAWYAFSVCMIILFTNGW